jgi:uncharacterized membrane protein YgcG
VKSVLLKFFCLSAVLVAISACQKLTPDNGVYKVRIPVDNGQGHYVLQTKELRTVTDLSAMAGSTAVFKSDGRFDINLDYDGKAVVMNSNYGNTPAAQFVHSSGVYIPADYVSLSMTAAMYHFEAIKNFYDTFGANKDLKFPRTVLINVVEAYRRGDEQMVSSNNAAYVPSLDVFFINPYKQPDVPLPLNGGVLAHEYLHSVFATKFNMTSMNLRDQGLITPAQFESLKHVLSAFRLDEWKSVKPFNETAYAEAFARDHHHRDDHNGDSGNGGSNGNSGDTGSGSGSSTGGANSGDNGDSSHTGHNHDHHSGDSHSGDNGDTGDDPSPDVPPTGDPGGSGDRPTHPTAPPPDDVTMSAPEIRAANDLIFSAINEGVADYYGYEYTGNPGWIVPSLPSQTFRDLSQNKTFTLSSLEQKKIIRKSISSHDPEARIDEHGLGAYFSHFLYIVSSSQGGWGSDKTERNTLDFLDRYSTLFAQNRDTRFISMGDLVRLYFAEDPAPASVCPQIVEMFPGELNYSNLSCGGGFARSELR